MRFKKHDLITRARSELKPEYWRVESLGRVTIRARNINNHKAHVFHVADVKLVPEKKKNMEMGLNDFVRIARKVAWEISLENGSFDGARNDKPEREKGFAYAGWFLSALRSCAGFLTSKLKLR